MDPRHEAALINRLEEVCRRGWAYIHNWEAYLWYNADRFGRRAWRDIDKKLHEIIDDDEDKAIFRLYFEPGGILIVYSSGPDGEEYMESLRKRTEKSDD